MQYIGIDGCRTGWFWVALSDAAAWAIGLYPDAEVLAAGARLMLFDVPIGLPDSRFGERQCDREARAVLGRPRVAGFKHLDTGNKWWREYFGDSVRSRQRQYFAGAAD